MKPHEFFELTPSETVDWTSSALEGQFGLAWRIEVVRRMGKKLPQRPSDLWKAKKSFMTPAEMLKHMKEAVAEQKKTVADMERRTVGERRPSGKTMRDFRGMEK